MQMQKLLLIKKKYIAIDDNDFILIDSSSLSTTGSSMEYEFSHDKTLDCNSKNYDGWKCIDEIEFQ